MTAPDLLPCPFCGAEQDDHGDLDHDGFFCRSSSGMLAIGCSRCMCIGAEGSNRAEAIAAWNRRAMPAAQVTVKPLDLSEPSFVIHASGSFSFFSSAQAAEDYADSLGRHSYEYNPDTVELYGKKLKIAHDEWIDEMQKQHEARIRSALTVTPHDPAKVQALVEAGERMTGPLWRLILADEHCLKSPCDMPTCECRQKFDRIAGPWTAALAAMKEG